MWVPARIYLPECGGIRFSDMRRILSRRAFGRRRVSVRLSCPGVYWLPAAGRSGHVAEAAPPYSLSFPRQGPYSGFRLQSGPGFFRILFPFIPERTREKNFLPVLADSGPQMVKAHGHKIPVLKITAADQCQRGCLHPSERVVAHAGGSQAMLAFTPNIQSASLACPRRPGRGSSVT